MMPAAAAPRVKRPAWKLVCSLSALFIMVFFLSFEAGVFYVDRLERIGSTFSIGSGLALAWTVSIVLRELKSARSRVMAFVGITVLQVLPVVGGFQLGRDTKYPAESRALVGVIRQHARQLKIVKEQLRHDRQSIREPEQLLAIEPLIISWDGHIKEVSRLESEIAHYELPTFVKQALAIAHEGLAFDRRQVHNLKAQIAVLHAAGGLGQAQKTDLYKRRLLALVAEEEEIEREREAADLDQRIKDIPEKAGYQQ